MGVDIKRLELDSEVPSRNAYVIPFREAPVKIFQGYNGSFSHFPLQVNRRIHDDRFAIDFEIPYGTPVVADKKGFVLGDCDWFKEYYEGLDLLVGLSFTPNMVILSHDDGSCTLYAHLAENGVFVKEEKPVEQGEVIAKTGRSGWVGPRPHLHFEAYDSHKASRKSFPVRFNDYDGQLEHRLLD